MKAIYTLIDTTETEGEIDLDHDTERAVLNAADDTERRDILEPLITEHALAQGPLAMHERTIRFGIDGSRNEGRT